MLNFYFTSIFLTKENKNLQIKESKMKTAKNLKPKIGVSCNGISDHLEINKVTKLKQLISI